LSDAEKLLGSLQEDAFINYIILLVKKHIYYHKHEESIPNYEDFLKYVEIIRKTEKCAKKMNMKSQTSGTVWSLIEA